MISFSNHLLFHFLSQYFIEYFLVHLVGITFSCIQSFCKLFVMERKISKIVTDDYAESFLNQMWEWQKNMILTDLELVHGEEKWHCHSTIMASASPVLKDLIINQNASSIRIECVPVQCVPLLIEYAYTGSIDHVKISTLAVGQPNVRD